MKKIYLILLFFYLIVSTTSAQCSLYPVSLASRIQQSTLILEGKVIARQSFWNSAKNYIYTSNLVEVKQILKGELSGTRIEIITEGGELGLMKQSVEPSLQLVQNDEGVFTLINHSAASQFESPVYQAYSDAQGFIKFNLNNHTASAPFDTYKDINGDFKKELENLLGRSLPNLVPQGTNNKYSNNTIASVTGFSPTIITAGTFSVLTITGAGFGTTQGTSIVEFKNADDGGATFIGAAPSQYISWSNTQIQVIVPTRASTVSGTAGTGQIRVTVAGSPTLSTQTLTVNYGELNVYYSTNSTMHNTRHVDLNGSAGITWRMYTSFDANAAAKASFLRSFSTWRCNTYINWLLGATTTTNAIAFDGIDIIRFDIGSELPAGVLGRCTSYYNGCIVGLNVYWYVSELDICFDEPTTSAITWQFGPANATGVQYDFETVSLHELGHGHQLSHVINTNDPMHYALANAQNKRSLITQDIAAGLDVMTRNVSPGICTYSAMAAINPTLCGASAPTASFTVPTNICIGQSLNLIDQSTNSPTSWSWTITGSSQNTSSQQSLTVTYATAGIYTITLVSSNGIGSSIITTNTIAVIASPTISVVSASICSGSSTLVTASGALTYTWNPGALNGASQNLNPPSSTIYTITGAIGSCLGSGTVAVNVVASPSVIVSNAQICSGNSTLVTATGASSYTWNPGNLVGATQNLNPTVTTIYSVTGANSSCQALTTLTVSVFTTPTISANNALICSGSPTLITASGASSYSWNPGNLIGASQNLNPVSLTVYTITGANGSCIGLTTLTVNILTSPTLVVNNALICAGSSTLMLASGASSYTWNPGNLIGASQLLAPHSTVIYTLTGTTASCNDTKTLSVTVNIIPALSATNASVCAGSSVNVIVGGATSYTWNPGNLSGSSQFLQPLANTIYTITGSNGTCLNQTNVTVSVTSAPLIVVTSGTLCAGSSTILTASGANSYTWNTATYAGGSATVNPLSTTIYSVIGSLATNACTSIATATLTVFQLPSLIAVANPSSICLPGTSTLSASGALTYTWNPNGVTSASCVVNPVALTIYTVNGSDGNCYNTATVQIGVNNGLTISVNDATICSGATAILSASGATSYSWNPGSLSSSSISVSPAFSATYQVQGFVGACTASTQAFVTVLITPTITVPDLNPAICIGQNYTTTYSGATTYTTMPGNFNGPNVILNPTATTIFTVTASSPTISLCDASLSYTLNVFSQATLNIVATPTFVCLGSSATLSATGGTNYIWNPGNLSGSNITISPSVTTIYTITTLPASGSCTSSAEYTIGVRPNPTISINPKSYVVCYGNTAALTANGASHYTWKPGNLFGSVYVVAPAMNTTYTVTGETNGCSKDTTAQVIVSICANIPKSNLSDGLQVYPNPFNSNLNIDFDAEYTGKMMVYTTLGQLLQEHDLKDSKHVQLNLVQYAKGVYFIKLVSENENQVYFKVLKD